MKRGLIITLPKYDTVTEYLSQFSNPIIKEAENNNISYKELRGKEVNKENFGVIKNVGYKFLVLNGHGTAQAIHGHNNEPIIEEGINEEFLKERITYARACNAAASLGKSSMQDNNTGCFIGYNLPFEFYHDITWEGNPLRDPIAPLIFRAF